MIISAAYSGGVQGDLYWSRTVFLLKNISINGATNNSFRDDGPYNFLPTRNGDVTQGSFSPFGPLTGTADPNAGGGSVWLEGPSGNAIYTNTSGSSTISLGTGNFTVEFWWNPSDISGTQAPVYVGPTTGSKSLLLQTGAGDGKLRYYTDGGTTSILTSSTALTTGNWAHIALVRNGTTVTLYQNGVSVGSGTDSSDFTGTAWVGIGFVAQAKGLLSNVRIVKSAVYTAAFAPPTSSLTAIANTVFLACQSATSITDAGSGSLPILKVGTARAVSDSPFGYGSVYFDGSGDWLTTASTNALAFGTGDYTVEAWVFLTSTSSSQIIVSGAVNGSFGLRIGTGYNSGANGLGIFQASVADRDYCSYSFTTNQWYHVAAVRQSGTVKFFINGVQQTTAGTSTGSTSWVSETTIGVGGYPISSSEPFFGYISNARVVKGTAVYTSSFTPPTAPLTAISGTSLLTCQDKGSIVDASTNSFTVSRVGDAKPVGMTPFAQKPAGYWSVYFDGGANIASSTSSTGFSPGSRDFTLEAWIYPTQGLSGSWGMIAGQTGGCLYVGTVSGQFVIRAGGYTNVLTASSLPSLNTWTHVVAVRSGNNMSLFFNGTRVGTVNQTPYAFRDGDALTLGNSAGSQTFGYISNLRMVLNQAVYDPTATTITVPTSPLTAIPGTALLTFQDARGLKDSSPNNLSISPNSGSVPVSRLNPFGPSLPAPTVNLASAGSVYMDGSGSGYLTAPANSQFLFSGDLTIEAWICPNSTAYQTIYATGGAGANDQFTIKPGSGSAEMYFCGTAGALTTTGTIPVGAWSHVAVSRSGSTVRGFINGVLVGSVTYASAVGSSSVTPRIGYRTDNVQNVNGYLSNVRVVNGTALYTSSFTPSTSPLTAVSGTALLTCQDAATITDASSNAFTVTKVGTTAVVSDATPFKRVSTVYSGSAYFDGSGDYLAVPGSTIAFGTGDFTIEAWINPSKWDTATGYFNIIAGSEMGALQFCKDYYNNKNLTMQIYGTGTIISSTVYPDAGYWSHVVLVRKGTTLAIYVNGVRTATATSSHNLTCVNPAWVGYCNSNSVYYQGYISNLRCVKGVAVYDPSALSFTPPVAPVEPVGGTSLLLNFDNAGIYDGSNGKDLALGGTAKVSATQAKFGTTSLVLDSTSWVHPTPVTDFAFGTGDFTIEAWAYISSMSSGITQVIYDNRTSTGDNGNAGTIVFYVANGGLYYFQAGADRISYAGSVTAGSWNHIALCRSNGSTRIFLNGTQVGSTYSDSGNIRAGLPSIGSSVETSLPCYYEDFRVTKSARYTANFTPPTLEAPTRKA